MDNGPHSLDVVETIAGPVLRIRMLEEKREQRAAVEDEVVVETEHAGGVRARLLLSWNRQIPAPIARCIGTDGEILVGWAQTVVRDANGEEVVAGGYDKRQAFKSLVEDFLRRRRKSESEDDARRRSRCRSRCRSSPWYSPRTTRRVRSRACSKRRTRCSAHRASGTSR
jgi:hypothetical protein